VHSAFADLAEVVGVSCVSPHLPAVTSTLANSFILKPTQHPTSNMKFSTVSLLALSAAAVNARFIEPFEQDQIVINNVEAEKYLIELAPGETRWVTEDEKWELRRVRLLQLLLYLKQY
jgi:hypothetical protein